MKKLEKNLFEIRSQYSSNIQRAIYFTFNSNHYVITHGFTKKVQKTLAREINKAKARRENYKRDKKEIMTMSKIDDYISKRSRDSSEFAQAVTQYNINLEVAVQVKKLRDSLGLTQREFADLVNKPQSTIARIESGSFNASTMLLSEIAQAVNRKVKIEFTRA